MIPILKIVALEATTFGLFAPIILLLGVKKCKTYYSLKVINDVIIINSK